MKKLITTAFLGLVGVTYAQSTTLPALSPIYTKFYRAYANTEKDLKLGKGMETSEQAVDRASSAYICAAVLKNIIETSNPKDIAGQTIEVGKFKGSYPEAQKYCETRFNEEFNKFPDIRRVPEEVAYIAHNTMVIEDERYATVDEKVQQFKEFRTQNRYFDSRLFYTTLAVDLYLTKYPELREQRFQRGSVIVGKGSEAIDNSLQALSQEATIMADYYEQQNKSAQAEKTATEQKILTDLKNLYIKVMDWQQGAEKLMQAKKYQEAQQVYFMISTQDQPLRFVTNDLKQQNINKPIDVNGKKINASDAVAAINKAISTSMQKASGADNARQQAQQALAAQWKQAAKNTLKGDRLTIFNRFGIPNVLLPGDMYTGDEDIKRSMINIQKATGWKYSFNQTAFGGFFCNINVTFNGNKATSRSISASIVGSQPDAYCKSNYRF